MDSKEIIKLKEERKSLLSSIKSWSRITQFLTGGFADAMDRAVRRLIQVENELEDSGVKIKRYTKRGE